MLAEIACDVCKFPSFLLYVLKTLWSFVYDEAKAAAARRASGFKVCAGMCCTEVFQRKGNS